MNDNHDVIVKVGLYCAQATFNKKHYNLGRFKTLEEAAFAFDDFAKKNHGEFYKKQQSLMSA